MKTTKTTSVWYASDLLIANLNLVTPNIPKYFMVAINTFKLISFLTASMLKLTTFQTQQRVSYFSITAY